MSPSPSPPRSCWRGSAGWWRNGAARRRAIAAAEAKFRGLVERSLAGIYIARDGLFGYANAEFCRMFACSAAEHLIDPVPVGELVAAEDRERVVKNLGRAISGESTDMRYAFVGLLSLSQNTRGELSRDDIDVSAMAGRIAAEFARNEPERRVVCEIEPGLETRGDRRMIDVVLRKLLGNAWKYTAHAQSAGIRVAARHEDGEEWFCVSDNGAGFDMAYVANLFQPFQRLHRPDEFPGLGIGLATVQRIVHRHGGRIRARAAPGEGAAFCFTLEAPRDPLAEPDPCR